MVLFWIIALGAALGVAVLLSSALWRAAPAGNPESSDIGVYRDQLAEVDRDLSRGIIGQAEAEHARIEVSRRILQADKEAQGALVFRAAPAAASAIAAAAIGALVIGATVGVYLRIGAPGYPDLPLAERIAQADAARRDRPSQAAAEAGLAREASPPKDADPKFMELIGRLRAAVEENPGDLQGQLLLARNEAMLGNYAAAHSAQRQVIAIKGNAATAADHAAHADMLVLAAEGYVSPEAEAALIRALELEPGNKPARYYLGQMHAQTGRPDLAFSIWMALLAESGPGDAWVPPITARIERIAQLAGVRFDPLSMDAPGRGPAAADMDAAAELTAEERREMIQGMVDGLAERLAAEGGPASDWARLITALGVLGEHDRAAVIWSKAQEVFSDAPDVVERIRAAAVKAGAAR